MTCIIGIIDKLNNKVVMGADSQITEGNHISNGIVNKLFKKDDMIFGFCGMVRFGDIIKTKFIIPPKGEKESDIEYMQNTFTNAIRLCLEELKINTVKHGYPFMGDSSMIVFYKNKLYSIGIDYSVIEYSNFVVDGSGRDYAIGVLEAFNMMDINIDPKIKVTNALDITCKYNIYCKGPYTFIEENLIN